MSLKAKALNIKENLINIFTDFKELQIRLLRFEDFLKSEEMKIFSLAVNKYFPATSCSHIITAYPSKRNGFYWIKNLCTPKPIRVYCDFDYYDKKGGLDYLIYNRNLIVNTKMNSFRKYIDIRTECAKLGLEPIEIKNYRMVKIIYYLLKKFKYDLNKVFIVPIATDYDCYFNKCSGVYRSLNDDNTIGINKFIESFSNLLKKNKHINKIVILIIKIDFY